MTASPPPAVEEDSLWLSRYERAMMEAETGGFPPYLKQLAKEALAAETAWRARLSTEAPETLVHLLALKAWFADPDKGASSFPGWNTPGWPTPLGPPSRREDSEAVVAASGGEAPAAAIGEISETGGGEGKSFSTPVLDQFKPQHLSLAALEPAATARTQAYQKVETALLAFDVGLAVTIAEASFDPGCFLTYESRLKARKAQGEFTPEWLADLVRHAGSAGGPGFAQAVQLLIDLEQADSLDLETLRRRLADYSPDPGLAWTRPYLLSRFHAFLDPAPNAFATVLGHLASAIDLLAEGQAGERWILVMQELRALLLVGSGPAMIARSGWPGALERYWLHASWLVQAHPRAYNLADNEPRQSWLAAIICSNAERLGLAADLGLSPAPAAPTDKGRVLVEHLNALGQALGELGFDPDGADGRAFQAFERAMAEDRLDAAEALLVAAEASVATGAEAMRWDSGRAVLWRRRGRLGAEIDRLRASYQTLPSARNGWAFAAALEAAGHDRRTETLAVAETLARRFWYLPAFQTHLYRVHHDLFTRQPDPPAARQALVRELALGPTWSLFGDIAEFERWQHDTVERKDKETAALHALIAGLADGMYLGGNYQKSIIAAFTLGWDEIGLTLFLLATRARPHHHEAYNYLAIGNRHASRTPVALAANARALNLAAEATVVPFVNSADDFRGLARADSSAEVGWRWALYRAVLAVWLSPQHTWLQYACLLAAAARLERPALFLTARCVGRDHRDPGIESRWGGTAHPVGRDGPGGCAAAGGAGRRCLACLFGPGGGGGGRLAGRAARGARARAPGFRSAAPAGVGRRAGGRQ